MSERVGRNYLILLSRHIFFNQIIYCFILTLCSIHIKELTYPSVALEKLTQGIKYSLNTTDCTHIKCMSIHTKRI